MPKRYQDWALHLCPLQMSFQSYLLLTSPRASDVYWIAACRDSVGKKRNCKGSPGASRKQVNPVSLKIYASAEKAPFNFLMDDA